MKKTVILFVSLAGAALLSGCNQNTPPASNNAGATNALNAPAATADTNLLNNEAARQSYAVGVYTGRRWKELDVPLDLDIVFRGIEDSMSNAPVLMTDAQMNHTLQQLSQAITAARQKAMMEEGKKNSQEGDTFLAENKTKPGVVTLPDGLQYKIITDGSGPTPGPNDTVVVTYTGKLVNGTVFDSTERRGNQPAEFQVRRVIPGWTEALEKMKVGSKWEIYIPANLAYGPMGPPAIGPNQTLIFQVELKGIKPGVAFARPPQPLTSDIIKVPSAEEMKKGAQIETIKASDLQKAQQGATN